jgi:hypothetical protein
MYCTVLQQRLAREMKSYMLEMLQCEIGDLCAHSPHTYGTELKKGTEITFNVLRVYRSGTIIQLTI